MRKISEYLREEREAKKLSLEEVERATKIKRTFLEAIEKGAFHSLPSESYAMGFVKNYASFLGINPEKAAALFRREYEREALHVVPEYQKKQHHFQRKFLHGPKIVLVLGIFLIVFAYIAFQYSSFFVGPELTITAPQNGATIEGNSVLVTGETNPYATVLVDGEEVYVNLDGTFEKTVFVFTGEKVIEVISKNRYGKQTQEAVTVKIK